MLGFTAICIAGCIGCMSHRVAKGLAPIILEATIEPAFEAPLELDRGANEFRLAEGRWPRDYAELSNFLENSDSETYRKLRAVRFSRIEFSNEPDGWLKVTAQYRVDSSAHTAPGIKMTFSGGTVTITNMRIGPLDPQELTVSPSH